jgi:hypothetical protein
MHTMGRHLLIIGGVATLTVLGVAILSPRAARGDAPPPNQLKQCFLTSEIENWLAPDPSTIMIRAGNGHYYRINLSRECSPLRYSDARLITRSFGDNMICSPTDLMIRASESGGFAEPCFVKDMSELTPQDVAALPHGAKP